MRLWPFTRKTTEVQKDQLECVPTDRPISKRLLNRYRSNEYIIQTYRKGTLPATDMILTHHCHEWDAYDGKIKWTLYDLDQEEIVVKSAGSCCDWEYYLVNRVEK